MGLSDYYDHSVARGIVKYAGNKPDWRLYGQGWMFSPLEDLPAWDGDGVITRLESAKQVSGPSGLTYPVGLFACNDKVGLRLSSVCAAEGFDVPGQIAILGVDNEDIPCELANPSLSSIELNLERIGALAAVQPDQLMNSGETTGLGVDTVEVPPGDIIERESTSSYAGSDPLVVSALRIIRGSDGHRKKVADLLDELASGRRSPETRSKRETGQTLHQALTVQKIRVAGRILRSTDKTMEAVAGEAGFGSVQWFFFPFP